MLKRNLVLLIVLIVTNLSLYSQTPDTTKVVSSNLTNISYSKPKEYRIAGMTVAGIKYLSEPALIQLTGLQLGDTIQVPGEEITSAIEKLWKQGLFSDIRINATHVVNQDIYLEIYLQERPRLSAHFITGAKKGEAKDLEEKITLTRGSQVTENMIIQTTNTIKNYYIDKGFLRVKIDIVQKPDTTLTNCSILNINVTKNARIKVKQIQIEGDKVFSARKIRRLMKETKQKRFFAFKRSKYIEAKYKEDKVSIITKYTTKGFRDARIVWDTVYDYDANFVMIKMKIDEGRKYYFRKISWVGNTKYTSLQLTNSLGIKKGDVFDQEVLDKRLSTDQDAVGNLYLDDGYLFYNAVPVELNTENDSIDLEIRIREGKQATINKVTISGNNKTNEHVIRREIRTKPGELFSKADIIRSVRELAQLGHFDPEKITPTPVPNPSDGTVDLEYTVEEKSNDQIELSGGWGANMLVGSLGLKLGNFSARQMFTKDGWKPIPSGDGQTLAVRFTTNGSYYQNYSISFTEPWLGGKKANSLSATTYYSIQTNGQLSTSSTYESMKTTALVVGLGRRLSWPDDYFILSNEISLQNYNLYQWPASYFVISNGDCNNFSFGTTLSRSSIDNPFYTRMGSLFSLSLKLTPPYSLFAKNRDYTTMSEQEMYHWIEYYKINYKMDWFTRIVGNLVLRSKIEGGYLGFYNTAIGPSPFEGFYLGGDGLSGYNLYGRETIGLRGYANGALTPSTGGNIYNKYTLELRFPLSLNPSATIYVLSFLEAGNAWTHFSDYNPFDVNRSAGIGVRFILPMLGVLGVDWGYGFDPIPGKTSDNWRGQWHFVLGQQN